MDNETYAMIEAIMEKRSTDDDAVIVKQWVQQGALLYDPETGDPVYNPMEGSNLPYDTAGVVISACGKQVVLEDVGELACSCCRHGWMETISSGSRWEPDDEEHICHKFGGESATVFCRKCRGHHWTDDSTVTEDYDRQEREYAEAEDEFYRSVEEYRR